MIEQHVGPAYPQPESNDVCPAHNAIYTTTFTLLNANASENHHNSTARKQTHHRKTQENKRREKVSSVVNVPAYISPSTLQARIDDTTLHLSPHPPAFVRDPFGFGLLPNGEACAIPNGTSSNTMEVEPMHLNTLDAIDLARISPDHISAEVAYYLRNSRAPKTVVGYRWAWGRVLDICGRRRLCPLPMSPQTCCEILAELADEGLVVGSIRLILCTITVAHRLAREPAPSASEAVRSTMRGIGRTFADRKLRQMTPISPVELRLVFDRLMLEPNRQRALRDWALILIGFAGAFRRSELVALDDDDLEVRDDHVIVMIGRSKTDQLGRGAAITIHRARDPDLCPVAALKKWLKVLPGPGPLFRPMSATGDHILARRLGEAAVGTILKRYASTMNLDGLPLNSHSLRAGFVTEALSNQVPDAVVMDHTRHKTHESLKAYFRPRSFSINMTERSGL